MNKYCLPDDYIERLTPQYFDDRVDDTIYQPDVYNDALTRIKQSNTLPIFLDLGCGKAQKLLALKTIPYQPVGVDYGENIKWLQKHHMMNGTWIEQDLETITPDLPLPTMKQGITVMCVDVIEHLINPIPLLQTLKAWQLAVREIVITTPDRLLYYGMEHKGPPPNPCHVREWSMLEFVDLLKSVELSIYHTSYVRSVNTSNEKKTIQVICRNG